MDAAALHAFAPSAARAAALDARMHRELGGSLAHLAEACEDALPAQSAALAALAARLQGGARLPPLAFATYFRLARALLAGRTEAAAPLVAALAAMPDRAPARMLRAAGEPAAAPLLAALADPGAGPFEMAPVPADTARAFAGLIDEGLALMDRHLPELHGEISGIVHEILLGHAPPGRPTEFDGASHYQFWGLLMLNPKHHRTPLALVEVLAHEAAHSLLFGLTVEEPLVFNPDAELYPSPLRRDPRPMDGIYHATFVSARMAWAMERMAGAGGLSDADRAIAAQAARTDRENFGKGIGVVDAHARLSPTGAAILAGARAAMSAPAF